VQDTTHEKESQDEYRIVDRTGFTGSHVWHGGSDEDFSNRKSQRDAALGKRAHGWFCALCGISELLGTLGLFLPILTGILPWLTPLAAVGLAVIQVLAIFSVHLPKKEYNVLPINAVLLAIAVFVVIGRWPLFS